MPRLPLSARELVLLVVSTALALCFIIVGAYLVADMWSAHS